MLKCNPSSLGYFILWNETVFFHRHGLVGILLSLLIFFCISIIAPLIVHHPPQRSHRICSLWCTSLYWWWTKEFTSLFTGKNVSACANHLSRKTVCCFCSDCVILTCRRLMQHRGSVVLHLLQAMAKLMQICLMKQLFSSLTFYLCKHIQRIKVYNSHKVEMDSAVPTCWIV